MRYQNLLEEFVSKGKAYDDLDYEQVVDITLAKLDSYDMQAQKDVMGDAAFMGGWELSTSFINQDTTKFYDCFLAVMTELLALRIRHDMEQEFEIQQLDKVYGYR